MLSDDDAQASAAPAAGLPLDLEQATADDHGVIERDDALVLLTQDGVEIDGAHPRAVMSHDCADPLLPVAARSRIRLLPWLT